MTVTEAQRLPHWARVEVDLADLVDGDKWHPAVSGFMRVQGNLHSYPEDVHGTVRMGVVVDGVLFFVEPHRVSALNGPPALPDPYYPRHAR